VNQTSAKSIAGSLSVGGDLRPALVRLG